MSKITHSNIYDLLRKVVFFLYLPNFCHDFSMLLLKLVYEMMSCFSNKKKRAK